MYLISGTTSGLGKYFKGQLNAIEYSRKLGFDESLCQGVRPFKAIIHCAFNANHKVSYSSIQQYVDDNVQLTQKLLKIPHKKFIFISSSDIYPRKETVWCEEDDFQISEVDNIYGFSKLFSEALVKSHSENHLILRPTAFLGTDARMNSLMKVLSNTTGALSLSPQSSFNYILHTDALAFIHRAIENNLTGIYNLAANTSITLGEVAELFNNKINFGSYTYKVSNLSNEKVKKVCNVFDCTSLDNIKRFKSYLGESYAKR